MSGDKPLAIDLFCGLGGWTEGLLAEGYRVVGFDIEAHEYDGERYPAELILADVLDLHGSRFADADLIVASPPCQEYSYMAMPWSKAKAKAAAIRADATGAELERLNRLFNACFRIQREASEAAGRHIPMVVENVRGAIPWVGRSRWNYGSFHLWGDVPALMPSAKVRGVGAAIKHGGRTMCFPAGSANPDAVSGRSGEKGWGAPVLEGVKAPGMNWSNRSNPNNRRSFTDNGGLKLRDVDGYERTHPNAFGWKIPATTSKGKARKAASARIAKIPLTLSRWIAAHYRPDPKELAA